MDALPAALRQRLTAEESRSAELDRKLEEAAALGRMLLSNNEELQQEVEFWRGASTSARGHRTSITSLGSVSEVGEREFDSPLSFMEMPERRSRCGTEPNIGTPRRSLQPRDSMLSGPASRRHSVDHLAKEYELDLQELLAENQELRGKVQHLERDRRSLIKEAEESAVSLEDAVAKSPRPDLKERTGSDRRHTVGSVRSDGSEQLRTELLAESACVWDLRNELAQSRQECTRLVAEYQEHLCTSEAMEEELLSWQQRYADLADACQQEAADRPLWPDTPMSPKHTSRLGALAESFGPSLASQLRLMEADGTCGGDADELLGQLGDVRAQLALAERTAAEHWEAVEGQVGEAQRLRERLGAEEGAARRAEEAANRHRESLRLCEAETGVGEEALRAETAALRRRLALAEAGQRSATEARDAALRQRELARKACQGAQHEAEEMRKQLLTWEDRACQVEARQDPAGGGHRAVLKRMEELRRNAQAEAKARRFIEAELLRTLAGIRNMDTQLHQY